MIWNQLYCVVQLVRCACILLVSRKTCQFPTCQVRVVRFLDVMTSSFSFSFFSFSFSSSKHHLPARQCSETRRTSSAATQVCTCQVLIGVDLAGLLQCDSLCGPRRTFTTPKSLWASPDFYPKANFHAKSVSDLSSKEVWKLNFRQYGKMERAQQGRNSDVEKVRSEKIRDGEDRRWRKSEERRCRCAKR